MSGVGGNTSTTMYSEKIHYRIDLVYNICFLIYNNWFVYWKENFRSYSIPNIRFCLLMNMNCFYWTYHFTTNFPIFPKCFSILLGYLKNKKNIFCCSRHNFLSKEKWCSVNFTVENLNLIFWNIPIYRVFNNIRILIKWPFLVTYDDLSVRSAT